MSTKFKEINAQLDIRAVCSWLGLKENNAHFICCPFHLDKRPSMRLYPDNAYCFACNTACDCIGLTAQVKGLSQTESAKLLCEVFSLPFDVPLHGDWKATTERKRDITAEMISLWCTGLKRLLALYVREMAQQGITCDWGERILDDGFLMSDTRFYSTYADSWEVNTWLKKWKQYRRGQTLSKAI